ncbi:SMP-30/gluconolactonase/LRE family protein [Sphingomonas sp. KR1UV-12]|uniref:SMP-30/gluconolactonase/LRE family protein n=1 Tax=Sphingomonas aurea TaxID=3063994 RepID=A0ABT9EK67_9SPHN|nr:SMP-30/gluconolactonase/LRE family protein [Sphingomonas sp. KR1UV-12]MDP1027321.1 SMP-30/gluconolactonase/LRE family protein [Sphingomonas sp. KR1UV-12]
MDPRQMTGFAPDRRRVIGAGLALLATPAWAAEAPVARVRRLSPKLDRMVAPDAAIETVATGIRWAEGPLWVERGGYLLFTDPPANVIRRWQPGRGAASVFLSPSGLPDPDPKLVREAGANGLALARDGALLIANSGGRSIDRVDLVTGRRTVLVDRYRGQPFNSPNDLHVARDGTIWFTDPPYGLVDDDRSPLKKQPHNGVYRWRQGTEPVLIDGTLTRPNGVALSPDERRLYVSVSDDKAPRIMVYDLDARGMPTDSRVLLDAASSHAAGAPGLPDGMKVARDGTLVCSAPGGILFLSPEGETLGMIENGQAMANCAFGQGGRSLFIAASDRVLRVPLRAGWQG